MKVESVAISSLVLDPSNARKHSQKNLEAIKGSLARFGQQKPIVVGPNNVVIAGNGTLSAAQALGWDNINVVRSELAGADLTAFGIADNRTSELAEWDNDILGKTLQALREEDFDLTSIGFDTSYLDNLYVDAPVFMEARTPDAGNPPQSPSQPREIEGARELNADEFSNFNHQCPRCGFEFNK